MKKISKLLSAVVIFCAFLVPAQSAVMVDIRPSEDKLSVEWHVSWTDLSGNAARPYIDLGFMDPATGEMGTNFLLYYSQAGWLNTGNPFKNIYSGGGDYIFMDGFLGVESSPIGWGVGPDSDDNFTGDDLYLANHLIHYTTPFPDSGEFILTVPGAHIDHYVVGTHNSNPNVTIVVSANPIPEPGIGILVSVSLFIQARRRR